METPAADAVIAAPDLATGPPPVITPAPAPEAAADAVPFPVGQAARYSVANFGSATFYMLFNSGMPLYLDTYGLNPALIGLLANERSFVGALVQPVVGRMSDRTRTPLGRRRPFFLVGVPLVALALLLLAIHPPFWIMLGIMTIAAFFLAVAVDPYLALMADLFPLEQRGRVGGLLQMGNALGAITFSVLALALWSSHEFWVFLTVIVLMVLTWGYTFLTVREPPLPAQPEVRPARPTARAYVRDLLHYREPAKYTLAMMFFWAGNGGATPYVTLFGKHALGADDSATFLLPIMYIVVTALFAVPAGLLADRIGKKPVLTLGLLIYGVGAIVGSQSPTLLTASVALAFIGLGNACTAVLIPLMTDMAPPRRCAELVGIFSAATSFTQPLGAACAGLVVDLVSHLAGEATGYRWSFIFAGVVILIGAAILQTVHPARADVSDAAPLPAAA